eukprot:15068749-Alexandrium_andersonii.AAC.1
MDFDVPELGLPGFQPPVPGPSLRRLPLLPAPPRDGRRPEPPLSGVPRNELPGPGRNEPVRARPAPSGLRQ